MLRALETGGNLEVRVSKSPLAQQPSRNVVAELNNDIEDDGTLIIGAHYDTTPNSSGANDNGSGVAAALVVAERIVGRRASLRPEVRAVRGGGDRA